MQLAASAAYHAAGVVVAEALDYVDVLQLRSAVGRVLADRSFAENARAVGDRPRAVGGAALAADRVEEFAQRAAK